MGLTFPEPTDPVPTRADVFLGYLDYFRSQVVSKIEGLPSVELRRSRLPSGWTPIELLKHLTYVELRWVEAHDLAAVGAPGPRWHGAGPATLERILFHLIQEYARHLGHLGHLGHLDIVTELADGPVGE